MMWWYSIQTVNTITNIIIAWHHDQKYTHMLTFLHWEKCLKGLCHGSFAVFWQNYTEMLLYDLNLCQNILWNLGERYQLIFFFQEKSFIDIFGFKMMCKNVKKMNFSKCNPIRSLPSVTEEDSTVYFSLSAVTQAWVNNCFIILGFSPGLAAACSISQQTKISLTELL